MSNQSEKSEKDVRAARAKHETRLMEMANVVGVGVGRRGDRPVLKVFVTHKVPDGELRPDQVVPKSVDGIDVDVEELGVVQAQSDE